MVSSSSHEGSRHCEVFIFEAVFAGRTFTYIFVAVQPTPLCLVVMDATNGAPGLATRSRDDELQTVIIGSSGQWDAPHGS